MFTQPAFIRKNTPELREKLARLGYQICSCCNNSKGWLFTYDPGVAHAIHEEDQDLFSKEAEESPDPPIDCGENEGLFLALAALRDDDNDDYMQYFTDGKGGWLLHEYRDKTFNMITGMYEQYGGTCIYSSYHKATPEELVEHFRENKSYKYECTKIH